MKPDWPIPLKHTVLDPIHGPILLTDSELAVVDHALFRRLHHIRQNGLLYFLFPSASHTRFEHSLGVMHVADAMLRSLVTNSFVASEKAIKGVLPIGEAKEGDAVDFTGLEAQMPFLFRVGRLAALVHDLGHGPFSHTFDAFAPTVEMIEQVIMTDPRLEPLQPIVPHLHKKKDRDLFEHPEVARVEHEAMSCVFFATLWHELCQSGAVEDYGEVSDVAAVILGLPSLCGSPERRGLIPLLHDLVASAPADADRMDYLERDSRSIGVTYGLYDQSRLLKSIQVYLLRQEEHGGVYRLGFKESGLRAVENFVQARFELFVQVYYHKTNRAIQLMLDAVARRGKELPPLLFQVPQLDAIAETYLDLDDTRFLRVLRGRDPHWPVSDSGINTIAEDIHARRLWTRVYEGGDAGTVFHRRSEGLDKTDLVYDLVDAKATKGLDETGGSNPKGAALLRRTADGLYRHTGDAPWSTASKIIDALKNEEAGIARIYVRSSDPARADELRAQLNGV